MEVDFSKPDIVEGVGFDLGLKTHLCLSLYKV